MCVSLSLFIYLSFSLSLYLSLSLCLLSKLRHLPTLGMQKVWMRRHLCVCVSLFLCPFLSLSSLSLSLSVSLFSLSVFISYSKLGHMPTLGMQKVWLRRCMCGCTARDPGRPLVSVPETCISVSLSPLHSLTDNKLFHNRVDL